MTARAEPGAWFAAAEARPDADELLFCLPHAGGGGLTYSAWREAFPPRIAVEPVLLPGRENRIREDPGFDPEEVATAVIRRAGGRPYSLYGHSMGGVLALEAVRELARRGARLPLRLVVGGSVPPDRECHWITEWAALDDDAIVDRMGVLGGTPDAVLAHRKLRERIARVLRADLGWLADYRFPRRAKVPVPLIALAGRHDPVAGPEVMIRWRELAGAGFRLCLIDGGHFFHLERTAEVIAVLAQEHETPRASHGA
ncbi:thioesterase II family protein [Streptomyces sp. NPDC001668]|uniref:thioesterase II family protein n=1 Tax=unclassified Streptomyces TaxID=2593676 RepID=UPI00340C13FC